MGEVKERGLIFNAEMVRAILDGRKTQMRRIMNDQPPNGWGGVSEVLALAGHCPTGAVGDRLWVRETFATLTPGSYEPENPREGYTQVIRYTASDRLANSHRDVRGFNWRPSTQMPRWASRITLEITGVRVERLQAISEDDAKAEGTYFSDGKPNEMGMATQVVVNAEEEFAHVWTSIYGADNWKANPWLWVIDFKVIEIKGR